MKLHELSPAPGSAKKAYRKGRGAGSGNGKTAGKGHKGQKARSGGGVRPGFEGGQMPLQRRVPKRGFNNIFATRYAIINVSELERFDNGSVIDEKALKAAGMLKQTMDGVKILGNGELTKKLTVNVASVSKSAKEKIEKAGGKLDEKASSEGQAVPAKVAKPVAKAVKAEKASTEAVAKPAKEAAPAKAEKAAATKKATPAKPATKAAAEKKESKPAVAKEAAPKAKKAEAKPKTTEGAKGKAQVK